MELSWVDMMALSLFFFLFFSLGIAIDQLSPYLVKDNSTITSMNSVAPSQNFYSVAIEGNTITAISTHQLVKLRARATGSMSPAINEYSTIIGFAPEESDLHRGDIILFQHPNTNETFMVLHRIQHIIVTPENKVVYIT